MKISIIGAGATGLAAAAYLHLISVPFTIYVRNEEKRREGSGRRIRSMSAAR